MSLQAADLPFSLVEFERRLKVVRGIAEARGFDVLVLQGPEDIYYITGFHTLGFFAYHALVVPLEGEACLVVRYGDRPHVWARSCIQNVEAYRDTEDPITLTTAVLNRAKPTRVGIDTGSDRYLTPSFLTPSAYRRLEAGLSGVALEECPGVVARVRAVKSSEELIYVRAAADVASRAVTAGLEAVGEGKRDRDVAAAVHAAMILAGGEYPLCLLLTPSTLSTLTFDRPDR
jgi:Xaa-Pro aminopeptidase